MMMRVKKSNAKLRLLHQRKEARKIIREICDGNEDPYVGYRRLYRIYCGTTGLHEELKVFFRIPGVEPDGRIRVDDEFREKIRALAADFLSRHPE
jgi:hypothetical protein